MVNAYRFIKIGQENPGYTTKQGYACSKFGNGYPDLKLALSKCTIDNLCIGVTQFNNCEGWGYLCKEIKVATSGCVHLKGNYGIKFGIYILCLVVFCIIKHLII